MQLSDWAERKRLEVRQLGPMDLRAVTPSIKDFTHAVSTQRGAIAVIAELARATLEEGALATRLNLSALVAALDEASVSAIAIATDPATSHAEAADLPTVAGATTTPVISRDLVLSREQLYQARLRGADAVLLTASVVGAGELRALIEIAASMHMAAPVEVRSLSELEAAIAASARQAVIPAFSESGALDLSLAEALLPAFPRTLAALVRGPFATPEELEPLRGRIDAVWIAGPLMRAADPLAFLRPLVEAAESGPPAA